MIAVLGLVVGVVVGLVVRPVVPTGVEPYLPIAVVAALDAVFGGLRAMLDGIFDDKVFVVSFLSNVVVAALIVFLGDKLGVGAQLSTGVVVVLGHPDLLQRGGHPPPRLPGVRPMSDEQRSSTPDRRGRARTAEPRARRERAAPADASAGGSVRRRSARPRAPDREPSLTRARGRAAGRRGCGRRGRSRAQLIVAVLLFVLGLGLAIQVRSTSDNSALRGARQEDLVRILTELDNRTQRLEDEKRGLESQRTELETSSDQAAEALQADPAEGAAARYPGRHGRRAGAGHHADDQRPATAVSRRTRCSTRCRSCGRPVPRRSRSTTSGWWPTRTSRDGTDGVLIDGHKVSQPYVFKVIGNPQDLEPALNIPGGVVQTLEKEQATADVVRSQKIVVDALRPRSSLTTLGHPSEAGGRGIGGVLRGGNCV